MPPNDTANLGSSTTGPMSQGPRMGAVVGRPYQEQSTLSAGEVLQQRFKILRFIARGGAGEVYEAYDLELRCPVALKIVRPEVAQDELAIERFRREIALARQVTHPNVSRIFDVFRHSLDGPTGPEPTLFLTMELLVGETLSQRIQEHGPMTPDNALPIIVDMVEGLKAAHRVGIIHRDFKSANVMLARQGDEVRAVITDFGLARGEGPESSEVTNTGIVVGTPYYMAPEQLTGETITPAADIYSLGIVIYEMLTGKRPFTGSNEISTAIKRLTQAPPSPRILRADLAPNWEKAILRCLEVDVHHRLTDLDELVAILTGTPTAPLRAPSTADAGAARRKPRVRPAVVGVGAVVLLIGLAAALGLAQWNRQAPSAQTQAASAIAKGEVAEVGLVRPVLIDAAAGSEWLVSALPHYLAASLDQPEAVEARVIEPRALPAHVLTGSSASSASSAAPLPNEPLPRTRAGETLIFSSFSVDSVQELVSGDLRIADDLAERRVTFSAPLAELPAALSRASEELLEALGAHSTVRRPEELNQELLESAVELLRNLNHPAARWLFEQAMPSTASPELRVHQARTLWRLGEAEEARRLLRRVSDTTPAGQLPREVELLVAATTAEMGNDFDEAERAWSALFEFFPENTLYGSELVRAQIEIEHWEEARHSLAELARIEREGALVDLLAARLAAASISPEIHLEAARTALRSAVSTGELGLLAAAHLELARALDAAGQPAEAFSEAESAVEAYERLGDFQAAQLARTISRFLAAEGQEPSP